MYLEVEHMLKEGVIADFDKNRFLKHVQSSI